MIWSPGVAASANLLGAESSPYLRHHAGDPISWHTWGEAALDQARREDKLILLSIGYSACHWCLVMARETFADPEVGRELEAHYVAILVDREGRPDLDSYWLQVAEGMTGTAGWPQNLILTPALLPLFAGNYFPPRAKEGQVGFLDVLRGLAKEWQGNRPSLLAQEGEIRQQMRDLTGTPPAKSGAAGDGRELAVAHLLSQADEVYGGFREEPKFPHATALSLLLREGIRLEQEAPVQMVRLTLDRMAAGGLRDPLGRAFYRYSVDRAWTTPHYERMLADNVLLARVYLEAYQATGERRYAWVARGVLEEVRNRFQLPEGGLATSLAADSRDRNGEMVEGAYDTWTPAQLGEVLGDAAAFLQAFALGHGGALRMTAPPQEIQTVQEGLRETLALLVKAREQREPPQQDNKILTSWNGLAAGVYALASRVLDEPRYQEIALGVLAPILEQYRKNGRVPHVRVGSGFGPEEFLDDYALVIQALLEAYETDFQKKHLELAWDMGQEMLTRFQEQPAGLLRLTPKGEGDNLPGQVLVLDRHGLPSGNGAAWTTLMRLNLWRQDARLGARLATVAASLTGVLGNEPHEGGDLLRLLDFVSPAAREVVIVGSLGEARVKEMLGQVRRRLGVGEVVAVVAPTEAPNGESSWPGLTGREMLEGKPTAYVCRDHVCLQPVTDPSALARLLQRQ